MSVSVAAEECTALGATHGTLEAYPNRDVSLGALTVTRALPIRDRRMVGPWCFLDRFGALQEIAQFREDWEARRPFGDVASYQGGRLAAPELARIARPGAMS
ncbi:hypothetical protein BAC2_01304 [uncultured bacterium]|nr:hypothetical protein BAC2_01304 [uncultured bacterium]